MKREASLTLIARQIAVFNGHVWDRLPPNIQIRYKTLAGNILATVERGQVSYRWEHVAAPDAKAGSYL